MKKADHTTDRNSIQKFQQIVNVGPACEKDFKVLGIKTPQQLIGKDPLKLYRKLCKVTGEQHDPCVLDVMMATVDYMNGNPPKKWWDYTELRKEKYAKEF